MINRPIRLEAQDAALSRLKQGFESPMGHTLLPPLWGIVSQSSLQSLPDHLGMALFISWVVNGNQENERSSPRGVVNSVVRPVIGGRRAAGSKPRAGGCDYGLAPYWYPSPAAYAGDPPPGTHIPDQRACPYTLCGFARPTNARSRAHPDDARRPAL